MGVGHREGCGSTGHRTGIQHGMAEAAASDHYHVMWGREPSTAFTALIEGHD